LIIKRRHRNFQRWQPKPVITNRRNAAITAKEVRLLDEAGEHMGVVKIEEALKLAMEKGLDLIEITENATPPVARIMSFDKFRYLKEKDDKKQKKEQKAKDMKRMRITPRMAENDLKVKAKKISGFLEKGHRVEIEIFLRGREKAHQGMALQKLENFLPTIETPIQKASEPKKSLRGFSVQIQKKP